MLQVGFQGVGVGVYFGVFGCSKRHSNRRSVDHYIVTCPLRSDCYVLLASNGIHTRTSVTVGAFYHSCP